MTFDHIFSREKKLTNAVEKSENSKKGDYGRKCVADGKIAGCIVKKLVFICWLCYFPNLYL